MTYSWFSQKFLFLHNTLSLDAQINNDTEKTFWDLVEDKTFDIEQAITISLMRKKLQKNLIFLPIHYRFILELSFWLLDWKEKLDQEIWEIIWVTKQRVNQVKKEALHLLETIIKNNPISAWYHMRLMITKEEKEERINFHKINNMRSKFYMDFQKKF